METAINDLDKVGRPEVPKLSAWLWSPWYAKLWWVAIPIWWMGMAASIRVDTLEAFYRGALAGYLNVLFFPMTALMVLGVGYVRERLDGFIGPGDGTPPCDEEDEEEEEFFARRRREEHNRFMDNIGRGTDMFDPRSGPLWIGNPLNPHNAAYINPHTRKHL
ncbi:hypothetical protein J2X47_000478 [Sphingomonas sp. BE270]|uniref:hypothetical protein n=1 Tax=Sphingomonas sp. BE270 TaxID=2817726 RepID=UPI0028590896|nr:hypothetical protein [Sphingomonas sp. BE270]MDR7256317.1 hypothetical protein [Sphingomonas sp. BE270]